MVFYPHDCLVEERSHLLKKLEKYERLKMLDAWNDAYARLCQIDSILEFNP